jgi:hypothetical protein
MNRSEIGVRKGTFFGNSKIPLVDLILLIYFWASEINSIKRIKHELNIGKTSAINWNMYLRELCAHSFVENPCKIGFILKLILKGGPRSIVEIDESLFVRRKYNRGRLVREQWVF